MFLPTDITELPLRPAASQISQNDWDVLSRFWHPVARASEVGDAPVAVTLLDVELVLFRSKGAVTGALDMCPHRWVRLSAGTVCEGAIVCRFHGLAFDGSGQCVDVPALGRAAKMPPKYRVRTFRTQIRYGMVWVCLDDNSQESIANYPSLEDVHDNAIGFAAVWQWPMSAARQIENFIDLAHLPFVHATTLGGDPTARIRPATIENRDRSFLCTTTYVETVPFEKPTECELSYEIFAPFAVDFRSRPLGGTGFRSVNVASPTSAHTCRVFQLLVRGEPGEVFQEPWALDPGTGGPGIINQQDIDVLQHLRIHDLPLNERLEIHLPVDNVSFAYRESLRRLGLGRR